MSTCGCCSGVTQRTPLEVANRPGLAAVAYRVGVHGDFLASLLAGLTHPDRPRLAALGTRDRDDFTIALLDAWAVSADVLAFYNERLAQESYLRTARQRSSLQELGRLLGYRLRPGVAAETYVAFALEQPPAVPAAASKEPGSSPPVTPPVVTLEPGLRIQSIPGPGEKPQTFETVEELEARPEWNALTAPTVEPETGLGTTYAYLQGAALNVKPGDGFAIARSGGAPSTWEFRALADVEPDVDAGHTLVRWKDALSSLAPYFPPNAPPGAYVFRKRLNVFGHNAPHRSLIEDTSDDWSFDVSPDATSVDVDGSHPDVVDDSYVVLSRPGYTPRAWRVDRATEVSRADYAVSGRATRLNLAEGSNYSDYDDRVRQTTVFGASELVGFASPPDESAVGGGTLDVTVDVSSMQPGRRILVRGTTTDGEEYAETAVVASVDQISGAWRIVLEEDLAQEYVRTTVVVHGNVARATHGETVQQLLGSGRAAQAFQRFTLAHEPLTHLQSTAAPSGAEPALEVRVNDVRWDDVVTLYGAGPRERAYVLRTDETGRTYVQFGDGERGARLPSGSNNVRATYRRGIGAAGNVEAGALAQLLDRPLGVKGVSNPTAASGGVDPETEEASRSSIPLGVRTLGRAVSLLDYEDYARAFTGVVKAHAVELHLRGGKTIVVTVAWEGGERLEDLADALRKHGDPRVAVRVLEGVTETFRLGLRVAVDPAYDEGAVLAGVEAALRRSYSFEARRLTQPVFRSELVAVTHRVPGVVAVDVDLLYSGTTPALVDRLLAQRPVADEGGDAIPAGVMVLDPAPLDSLQVLT